MIDINPPSEESMSSSMLPMCMPCPPNLATFTRTKKGATHQGEEESSGIPYINGECASFSAMYLESIWHQGLWYVVTILH